MHKRLEKGDRVITERDLVLKEYRIVRVTKLTAIGQLRDSGEVKFPREFESGSVQGYGMSAYILYAEDDPAIEKIIAARKAYQKLIKVKSVMNPSFLKNLSLEQIHKLDNLFQEILNTLADRNS